MPVSAFGSDMKYARFLILPLCLICLSAGMRTPDVDYGHKSLIKVLRKAGLEADDILKEITAGATDTVFFQGKFFEIKPDNEKHYKYVYVGRVNSCRAGGCGAGSPDQVNSASEYFDYFIIYDHNVAVRLVRVFNYQASHGHEVTAKGWLKQFTGYNGTSDLQVDKDVDAISGATVSVYAITDDVVAKTRILNQLKN